MILRFCRACKVSGHGHNLLTPVPICRHQQIAFGLSLKTPSKTVIVPPINTLYGQLALLAHSGRVKLAAPCLRGLRNVGLPEPPVRTPGSSSGL